MCVHEGKGLIAVCALLSIALVHRVHHHSHLLPGAAHGLFPLLGQFPWDKEVSYVDEHVDGRQSHGTRTDSTKPVIPLALVYVRYPREVSCQAVDRGIEDIHYLS